jgi:uncharacterized protein (DUF1697 family)
VRDAKKSKRSLTTYVALLRGINLGQRNKVSMADLRELFTSLGAEDVATYVQSGNVVFRSGERPEVLVSAVEGRLERDLGLSVAVLLRTHAEMARVVSGTPFGRGEYDPAKLHVTFLAERPDRARVAKLDPKAAEHDEFRVVGKEVHLYCPQGYGRSKLTNAYFEKQLGVAATTRNWKTVTSLAELSAATARG